MNGGLEGKDSAFNFECNEMVERGIKYKKRHLINNREMSKGKSRGEDHNANGAVLQNLLEFVYVLQSFE